MKTQKGFTLVELVVVILILGILSAVAIPKFISLEADARRASAEGLYGSIQAASSMVHALALAQSQTAATGTVTGVEGVANLAVVFGYPSTASIDQAVTYDNTKYTFAGGVFSVNGATTPASCSVTFANATQAGTPPVTTPPTITLVTTGC